MIGGSEGGFITVASGHRILGGLGPPENFFNLDPLRAIL